MERRQKKVISYHESDEEEEEQTPKATPVTSSKKRKAQDSDDDEVNDEVNSDEEKPKKTKKKPPAKAATGSKKPRAAKRKSSDDEDEEDEEEGKKKRSRKSTTPTKKRSKRASDDDDEEEVEEDPENEEDEENEDDEEEDDEDDDDEENGDEKPSKARSSTSATRKPRKTSERSSSMKVLTRLERLEEARKAYKWWEAEDLPNGVNWRKLEHPGILFPASYVRHGVPLLYDGAPVDLTLEQEEIATFYASIPEDGPQLGNPKTRPVFQQNFFTDFKASLGTGHAIKKFEKCNFSQIRDHLTLQKSIKKAATDDEKAVTKREKEVQALAFGYALIDGRIEKVSPSFASSLCSALLTVGDRWGTSTWSPRGYSVAEASIRELAPSREEPSPSLWS
jgi:DNA topoisomerase I